MRQRTADVPFAHEQLIADVAIEKTSVAFDKLFSFNIPDELIGSVEPGIRVFVPFGRGNTKRQGFVFNIRGPQPDEVTENLKSVYSVIDSEPLIGAEFISLASFIRERCFCTYFSAARAIIPGGICSKTEKLFTVANDIPPEFMSKLTDLEKDIISYLLKKKTPVRDATIKKRFSISPEAPVLVKMVKKGLLTEDADVFSQVNDLSLVKIMLASQLFDCSDFGDHTEKQCAVLELLSENGPMTAKEICYFSGVSDSVIRGLIKNGDCVVINEPVMRTPVFEYFIDDYKKPVLSAAQQKAFNILYEAYKSRCKKNALLFGVTGSGKTNVYLELVDNVISEGRSVIVLVPEISLTPQTFSLFRARYGKKIAVLHSGLSLGERHDEWKRIKKGEVRVVIGTRSAVFAPIENLGLIIIDEEQEHTYKSDNSPRYNAKDIARFRCAYNSALLVFASATPSVETYAKALSGSYVLTELTERYGSACLPDVITVDMTDKTQFEQYFVLSKPLVSAIAENLNNKEQTILLVNRRGYNTFVVCADCKKVMSCPQCSISLTYHSANNRLMCHYCGYSIPYVEKCPDCGAENIRYSGSGTQRVEQELKINFPEARVLRMDADTTTAKNAHDKLLSAFSCGEYDILLGTQMVAKGLDFPNVTLVGITSADRELYSDDFRCTERTFDLITQVVGRAGRGNRKGRAIIQTVTPDNDIIATASAQDYKKYFNSEIALRKALVYPPYCDICLIGFSGPNKAEVDNCAAVFLDELKKLNSTEYSDIKMIVLGPMPPKVPKVNNRYRQKLIIKSKNTERFRALIRAVNAHIIGDRAFKQITLYADINPENMN